MLMHCGSRVPQCRFVKCFVVYEMFQALTRFLHILSAGGLEGKVYWQWRNTVLDYVVYSLCGGRSSSSWQDMSLVKRLFTLVFNPPTPFNLSSAYTCVSWFTLQRGLEMWVLSEQHTVRDTEHWQSGSAVCVFTCCCSPNYLSCLPAPWSRSRRASSDLIPLCVSACPRSPLSLLSLLLREVTTQDTRWWSTRWSTTFTSSPAASSTPRSLPSLVCIVHRCKHAETLKLSLTHTHTHTVPRPSFLSSVDARHHFYSLHFDDCSSECDCLDSEPDCRLHLSHSSAVTSLANGVLLLLCVSWASTYQHVSILYVICRYLITFLLFSSFDVRHIDVPLQAQCGKYDMLLSFTNWKFYIRYLLLEFPSGEGVVLSDHWR